MPISFRLRNVFRVWLINIAISLMPVSGSTLHRAGFRGDPGTARPGWMPPPLSGDRGH